MTSNVAKKTFLSDVWNSPDFCIFRVMKMTIKLIEKMYVGTAIYHITKVSLLYQVPSSLPGCKVVSG